MEASWVDMIFPALILVGVFCLIGFYIEHNSMISRRKEKAGIRKQGMPKLDDSIEATHMLVGYINEVMDKEGRQHHECNLAGCSGYFSLYESSDIRRLLMHVHMAGGRLVVRRVSGDDIEDKKHTTFDVKKILSNLDIARARRIDAKYRRR